MTELLLIWVFGAGVALAPAWKRWMDRPQLFDAPGAVLAAVVAWPLWLLGKWFWHIGGLVDEYALEAQRNKKRVAELEAENKRLIEGLLEE